MIDIKSKFEYIKAAWIPRLLSSHESWAFYGKSLLNKLLPNEGIIKLNFTSLKQFPVLTDLPKFYQEVIVGYNKSKLIPKPENREDILDQVLWGNRHLKVNLPQHRTNKCIFYKSWINSGIIYIKDLKFINGKLDDYYIFQKIRNKRNIFNQVYILKSILKKFETKIGDHLPTLVHTLNQLPYYDIILRQNTIMEIKTKKIYNNLIQQKIEVPYQQRIWTARFTQDIDFRTIYKQKIYQIKDQKIAEFNYKVLNLILVCNKNLKTWKIIQNDHCEICDVVHDIGHLLYFCTKAKRIWSIVRTVFNMQITFKDIIIGDHDKESTFLISLLEYLIYKEWLIYHTDKWEENNIIYFIHRELKSRNNIYKKISGNSWDKLPEKIDIMIEYISNIV